MNTKNNNKSATNKKAFQTALMKKAAAKVTSYPNDSVAVEPAVPEVVVAPKRNEEAFKKALDLILFTYPATGRNKRTDFSSLLSLLLKLNVDTKSAKEISPETEKALNSLGFATSEMEGKEIIRKEEIPGLVEYVFNGYQAQHPQFCAVDADILHNCPNELESIGKKVWNPVIRYIACQTASNLEEKDAKLLMSGNPDAISDVLRNVKCADQTRTALTNIAPEMGKLVLTMKASAPVKEVIPSGNRPFAGLDPNDFPQYVEEEVKTKDFEEVYPEDRPSSKIEENAKQEETPEVEKTSEIASSNSDISSKQDSNIAALTRAIMVLTTYGDVLRSLEASGFTIEDAKSLVEADAIGFSFKEMLHNQKMVETLASIVNALK